MPNLLKENKKIMKYWNYNRNDNTLLDTLKQTSHKKVWWICDKGHEWQTMLSSRTETSGCPYCTSRKVLKGFNDLKTINPDLAKEWDYEKNSITPDSVMPNSNKRVWWKCSKGHEWIATCLSRNREKIGCPYCTNQKILKGFNDFESQYPDLLEEWNYKKNKILPSDITGKTNTKVWWICDKGHEWQTSIYNRVNGSMCPKCQSEKQTSFPEQAILFYLQKYGFNCNSRFKLDNKYEIDIFIKKYKIGIEYDGSYFHNKDTINKEKKKDNYLFSKDIHLIRVKEDYKKDNFGDKIDYICVRRINNVYDYNTAIYTLFDRIKRLTNKKINEKLDIDTNKDRINILNQYKQYQKNNSLLKINPDLAKEWNYEKNLNLKPDMFLPNSNQKVWWKCSKGHEWLSAIAWRNSGHNCPYCSNKILLKGFNDLKTINPNLAKEWDYEKNSITPDSVFANTHKKVWWKCPKCLNSYEASIAHRSNGRGCPKCKWDILSQKNIERHYDESKSFIKKFPQLLLEWNYEKNKGINPNKLVYGSHIKVWWKCSKGHEWENTIANRTKHNQNCPYCSNQKIMQGYNDLLTINPDLAKEWNYEKNKISPNEVGAGSGKIVWWQCSNCKYEWEAQIYQRNKGFGKCPNCKKIAKRTRS